MIYYIGNAEYDSDYLEHHGIVGQRKGVRRFQNYDRTWTELGKIRYGSGKRRDSSDDDKVGKKPSVMERLFPKRKTKPEPKKEQKPEAPKKEEPVTETTKKEEPSVPRDRPKKARVEWSDEELRRRITRAELEKKYNDLMAEKPKELSESKKFVMTLLSNVGKNLLSTYITQTVQNNNNSNNNNSGGNKKKKKG